MNNGIWAVYEYTSTGHILGKSIDGIKFLPRYATVHIEQQDKGTPEAAADLPYTVQLVNDKDRTDFVAWIEPDFNPATDLEGLMDVDIAVTGTPSATAIVAVLTTTLNNIAVDGFVVGDFLILLDNGTEQAPNSVTEEPAGTYTFDCTGQDDGSISLQIPSAMTTEGYESSGAVEFDIT